MSTDRVKAAVRQFRRKYSITSVSFAAVRDALEQMGYTYVPFLPFGNTPAVETVIQSLCLGDAVRSTKAFTYADRNYRLVFVRQDLSDDEKLMLLAHEAGHICLEHMSRTSILGRDVTEEYEANEFSHYLLHLSPAARLKTAFLAHKKRNIWIASILLLLMLGAVAARILYLRQTYYGNYYVTETGTKYHKQSCIKLRNSTTIRRLTMEEYESGIYEPCQVCLPED